MAKDQVWNVGFIPCLCKGQSNFPFFKENSTKSDSPRIFKPEDDEPTEAIETSQSTESSLSSEIAASGSGESSASYDKLEEKKTEPDDELSGQSSVKRSYIPTEVFEKGRYNCYQAFI